MAHVPLEPGLLHGGRDGGVIHAALAMASHHLPSDFWSRRLRIDHTVSAAPDEIHGVHAAADQPVDVGT